MLKQIYINPKKEKNLLEFLERHGPKRALIILFNYYTDFICKLDFTSQPARTANDTYEEDAEALNILGAFVK